MGSAGFRESVSDFVLAGDLGLGLEIGQHKVSPTGSFPWAGGDGGADFSYAETDPGNRVGPGAHAS